MPITVAAHSWESIPLIFHGGWSRGTQFQTPEAVLAFSAEGLGGMSRAYHRLYRSISAAGNGGISHGRLSSTIGRQPISISTRLN